MGVPILIIGEPGSGKTSSIRNLDPKSTFYIDCDKKGLNWRGWKTQYKDGENYKKTDFAQIALQCLKAINCNEKYSGFKAVIVDTLNGLMISDEMRRAKEKGYDKWQDLCQSIYDLVDYSLDVRDDLTVIFLMHSQTDRDDNGYMFTRAKTSGRKLDKISIESKFNVVLLAKCVDGKYLFEVANDHSTVRVPMGAFEQDEIPNDITEVLKVLEEF